MIMTKNTDQNEGFKFKTAKNDGFGASVARKLQPGDLVEWDSWSESLETEVFETKCGLLLDIIKEKRFSGWQYMAKISPFGPENEVILPLISIRKMQKRN
jgi:hypothetical protein